MADITRLTERSSSHWPRTSSLARAPSASLGIIALALAASGCSLIGLSIGAATPAYDKPTTLSHLENNRSAEPPEPGPDLRVVARDHAEDVTVDGAYASQTVDTLRLKTKRGYAIVRNDAIRGIDERSGSRWATGLLIGGAIDLALVILFAAAAPSLNLFPTTRRDLHFSQAR
jgi:hypothetical protein